MINNFIGIFNILFHINDYFYYDSNFFIYIPFYYNNKSRNKKKVLYNYNNN